MLALKSNLFLTKGFCMHTLVVLKWNGTKFWTWQIQWPHYSMTLYTPHRIVYLKMKKFWRFSNRILVFELNLVHYWIMWLLEISNFSGLFLNSFKVCVQLLRIADGLENGLALSSAKRLLRHPENCHFVFPGNIVLAFCIRLLNLLDSKFQPFFAKISR